MSITSRYFFCIREYFRRQQSNFDECIEPEVLRGVPFRGSKSGSGVKCYISMIREFYITSYKVFSVMICEIMYSGVCYNS